jgi:hypothetical protein
MTNKALASALIAVLVVLPAAGAQAQAAGSKPAGITVEQGKAPPPQTETKPMKTASAGGKRPIHINDDARFCLDRPTTAEIIKCAEPYRY